MVICTYCGTQVPDNTKFCTGCGTQLEQPEAIVSQISTEEDSMQWEQAGGTSLEQGGTPVQESYSPPEQQSYAIREHGGYILINEQSCTIPEESSYTLPQNTTTQSGYERQSSSAYSPMTQMPVWKTALSKKKLLIGGGGLLAMILIGMLIAGIGGKDSPKEDILASEGNLEIVQPEDDVVTQNQWNGTWYGALSVSEAKGEFADIETGEHDIYMVVELDDEGKGSFAVYMEGAEDFFAAGGCEAKDTGLYATDGIAAGGSNLNVSNWVFLPMRDYPDQYAMSDEIKVDDNLFVYYLYIKKWGGIWQEEVDSNFAIVPPSVEQYHAAIASGEAPPVGFAPAG